MSSSNYIEPKADKIAEKRILGAITCDTLSNNEISKIAFEEIRADYFYSQDTREMFEFIKDRFLKNLAYDIATIASIVPNELKHLVFELVDERFYTISMFNIDLNRLKILHELRPKLKAVNNLFHEIKQTNDPEKCMSVISQSIAEIQSDDVGKASDCQDYSEIVDDTLTQDEEDSEIKTNLIYWPPFPSAGMITIAGRSGTGKTFTGLHLMEHLLQVMPDSKAIYFNLEMKPKVLVERHLNMIHDMKGSLKNSLRNGGASELLKRDVHVVTRPGITVDEIELITTSQSLKKKVSVIVVDYVGQVTINGRKEKEYQTQEEIARRLSGMAVKLGCIVIALQQVNRESKSLGAGSIPTLAEAAGSQGFERSSEWWIAIHKPDVYVQDDPELKHLFIFQNRKQRGKHGYFTIYNEFRDGRFYEISQKVGKMRFDSALNAKARNPFENHYKNK